jgi:hypothetical protein
MTGVELSVSVARVDGEITVVGVLENHFDSRVRVESGSSKMYDVTVRDEEGNQYGQTMGYLQATHSMDISGGHSWVFSRSFETPEELEEELEDLSIVDTSLYDPLAGEDGFVPPVDPEYDRTLTATVRVTGIVNSENGEQYSVEESVSFVPSQVEEGRSESPELPVDEEASVSMGGTKLDKSFDYRS